MTGKMTVSLGRRTVEELDRRVRANDSTRSFEVRTAVRLTAPDHIAQRILSDPRFQQPAGDADEAKKFLIQILEKLR